MHQTSVSGFKIGSRTILDFIFLLVDYDGIVAGFCADLADRSNVIVTRNSILNHRIYSAGELG